MAGDSEQVSSVRRGPEEELFEKAKAEFERYFTEKRFQPTGDYKAAREALDSANAAYAEAKATLARGGRPTWPTTSGHGACRSLTARRQLKAATATG